MTFSDSRRIRQREALDRSRYAKWSEGVPMNSFFIVPAVQNLRLARRDEDFAVFGLFVKTLASLCIEKPAKRHREELLNSAFDTVRKFADRKTKEVELADAITVHNRVNQALLFGISR
jgi:hypothetical protein